MCTPIEQAELTKEVARGERLAHNNAGFAWALDHLLHLAAVYDKESVSLIALVTRPGQHAQDTITSKTLDLPIDVLSIVNKNWGQAFDQC